MEKGNDPHLIVRSMRILRQALLKQAHWNSTAVKMACFYLSPRTNKESAQYAKAMDQLHQEFDLEMERVQNQTGMDQLEA